MTILSSRAPATPSELAEMISASGVKVHIVEDRSVDPVETLLMTEAVDGTMHVLRSFTGPISLFMLTNLIGELGYLTDYDVVL